MHITLDITQKNKSGCTRCSKQWSWLC